MRRYFSRILVFGLIAVFGLSSCGTKVSVGLTYIPHNQDVVDEPLGVLRLSKDFTEHISVECEHISSAFEAHDVIALDHCGIFYEF